ncbi:MAG: sodium/solute symporter [Cetobacterium sp.]|uniref:sodium:solute symporter family transporter n=1 Tax=Cetobacterium sp. 8H TaxID=2759681 RepID=UPI00163C5587|nr:sodium/solute symporter [Cetobacterium sp. 8H]MBC2850908.1 sodium/solute symporter [Cetobacterium sp. 8H]
MTSLDWGVLISYFVLTIALGAFIGKRTTNVSDFFSGGREFKWWAIGLSVMATQISAITFIGAPGWAYQNGLKPLVLNLNIPIVMWILSGTFIPFFYNLEIISVYEYIEKRFGKKMRLLLVFTYIIKMLVVIGSIVYVPSLILSKITGLSINYTITLIIVISIFYTVLGGIQTVIWTDVFQMLALWVGIGISVITVFKNTPYSVSEIFEIAKENGKLVSMDFDTSLRSANTFWAGLFGGGILHLAYFGVDQTQVQRVLTAKSLDNTKYSLWFSGIFSVIQMFLFLMIGIVLFVFYKGQPFDNANEIYIKFALEEIPKGYLGVIIAAVFAATMSSIDSSLNSMTTVFMKDIYEVHFQEKVKNMSEITVTRVITTLFGILIMYFAFNVSSSNNSILELISMYGSYLLGAMLGVFTLGMFTTKADELGVVIGFILGILGTAIISYNFNIFWMWNNFVGFFITIIVGYALSFSSAEYREEKKRYIMKRMYFEKKSSILLIYFIFLILVLYFLNI